jgi:hypothetical protein
MNEAFLPVHRQAWIDEHLDIIRAYNTGNQLVNDHNHLVSWSGIQVTLNEIYNHVFFGTKLNTQGLPYCPVRLHELLLSALRGERSPNR